MNFIELSKLFHKNGYVYIEKFFNTALMDEYQDKIYNNFKEDSRDS
jgi:hypothetical protein